MVKQKGSGNSRFEQQKENSHVVVGVQDHTVPLLDSELLETFDELTHDQVSLRSRDGF